MRSAAVSGTKGCCAALACILLGGVADGFLPPAPISCGLGEWVGRSIGSRQCHAPRQRPRPVLEVVGVQADGEVEQDVTEPLDAPVGLIGHYEAGRLLEHRRQPGPFMASLDMSMTAREVVSMEEGIGLFQVGGDTGDDQGRRRDPVLVASWDELEKIMKKAKKGQYGCWELYGDGATAPWKVSAMSESTNRAAALLAPLGGPGPPTMVLGGFTMHRISGGDQKTPMDPGADTGRKVAASGAARARGRVLDTCTGLGYTAITAAKCSGVTEVVTVEVDDVSLEMCRHNPWSRGLFGEGGKVKVVRGDCCEVVKGFPDKTFAAIIHDPPARALCKSSDLYGRDFYGQLERVLQHGGTLFHYVGNPESKEAGRLFRGVTERLVDAGFAACRVDKLAFGVVASKSVR